HVRYWIESLDQTTESSSIIILELQPIDAMIASYLIYKERAGRTVVISVFISFSGVLIISWGDFSFCDMSAFSGNMLSFLSVVAVVCYFMIGQRSVKNLKHWF